MREKAESAVRFQGRSFNGRLGTLSGACWGMVLLVVGLAGPTFATPPDQEEPVVLRRLEVKERPFGELGIHAAGGVSMLALVSKDVKMKYLVITEVKAGSIAEKSGIKQGDRVQRIDGVPVTRISVRQMEEIWRGKEVGDVVRFEVLRGEPAERLEIVVPVEKKRKQPSPASAKRPRK